MIVLIFSPYLYYMRKHYVYYLISSIDGNVFYIGKGSGNRMYKHIQIAEGNSMVKSKNPYLYNKINKILNDGGEVICTKIFETNNEDLSYEKEKLFIEKFGLNNLTNITEGGLGGLIGEWDEERKDKLRKSKSIGNRKGKPHSEKTKAKIRETMKVKGYNKYWEGKKLSDETKKKMSQSHKGKHQGPITEKRRQAIIDGIKRKKSNK